jgi:hypothetical protein
MALSESHESRPRSAVAWLSVPMLLVFRGVVKKALLQDLNDLKSAVENQGRQPDPETIEDGKTVHER